MLANTSPEHGGRHVAIATLLLRLMQDVQHDALSPAQSIPDVRNPLVSRRRIIS